VNGGVELESPVRSHSKAELSPASTRRNSGGREPFVDEPEEGQRTEQNYGGEERRERNRREGDAICDRNDGDGMTFANGVAEGQRADQNGGGGRNRGVFANGMAEASLAKATFEGRREFPQTGRSARAHVRRRRISDDSMDDDKRLRRPRCGPS